MCRQQAKHMPIFLQLFSTFSRSSCQTQLLMYEKFVATPALLGDPWRMSSPEHLGVLTLLVSADCPSHSRGLLKLEACVRSGSRVSGQAGGWHKGRSAATYPHTGDSTAVARSQAGGSGQAGSGGGNSSHGHSEGDTGVSPGSKEPLSPTVLSPNPLPTAGHCTRFKPAMG